MDSAEAAVEAMSGVAKEGGLSGVGVGVGGSEDEAAVLGKEAAGLFNAEKYAECLDVLNQLNKKKPNDIKVLHNIAIAEFYNEGCSNTEKLYNNFAALVSTKKKSRSIGRASGENEDATSQLGIRAISVPRGNDALSLQISTSNGETMVYYQEYDISLATLNMAIIRFNQGKYLQAKSRLKSLFQNIAPIEEETALRVCLLLFDIAFATQDMSTFTDVMKYIEKAFKYLINQADNGNMGQHSPSDPPPKSPGHGSSSTSDGLNSDASGPRSTSDDKHDNLYTTLNSGEQGLPRQDNISSFAIDFKQKLPLFRIEHLILNGSLNAAKRELKQTINAVGRDSPRALLLKSQVEYARGNYPKALRVLGACDKPTVGSSIISNNRGCILFQGGSPHTAEYHFLGAVKSRSALKKEQPKSITSFSQDKYQLIAYNLGLDGLACGKPGLALKFFLHAHSVFSDRPLYWLRLGECCLLDAALGSPLSSESAPHLSGKLNLHVVGQGRWRYLAMHKVTSISDAAKTKKREAENHKGVGKLDPLSMIAARQYLIKALSLLHANDGDSISASKSYEESAQPSGEPSPKNTSDKSARGSDSKPVAEEVISSGPANSNGDVKDQSSRTSGSTATGALDSVYNDILRREKQMIIKQAVLVDLAFVELELKDASLALRTACSLLELPECSKMHVFLGHVYAAEALCYLGRPKEAAEHLSRYLTEGNKVELPYTSEDCDQWHIQRTVDSEDVKKTSRARSVGKLSNAFFKPEKAREAVYVNLAFMFAIQEDLENAKHCADQAMSMAPESPDAILMGAFLDLKHGHTEAAIKKLKFCNGVCFLSSDLKS
ncbi:CCR4-NOT transcription complex subunit 10-like protein [Drosera capensis]